MRDTTKQTLIRIALAVVAFVATYLLLIYGSRFVNQAWFEKKIDDNLDFLNPKVRDLFSWQFLSALLACGFTLWKGGGFAEWIRKKFSKSRYPSLDPYILGFNYEMGLGTKLVGREELFTFVNNFPQQHECGYIRIIAGPGLGKTAIAAALASRLDAPAFFTNANGYSQASTCVNYLSAAIIISHSLEYETLDSRSGENSSFLSKVLAEASEGHKKAPVWFIVDALDEADPQKNRENILLLPDSLPKGVYGLVTQRPGHHYLSTKPDTLIADYEITWDSDQQRAAALGYIRSQMRRPDEGFAMRLLEASEGNFMYLTYFFKVLDAKKANEILSSGSAPQGLEQYYQSIWDQIVKSAAWEELDRPIIALLAVAREPVTIRWLSDLSGKGQGEIQEKVFERWQQFLRTQGMGEGKTFTIVHRSFGDFVSQKLVLTETHQRIAAHFSRQEHWRDYKGYGLRNCFIHLRLAQDMAGLQSMMNNLSWYREKLLADPTGMSYENDINNAWLGAETFDLAEVKEGRPASSLGLEFQAALAAYTLQGYWKRIRAFTLRGLLRLGILKESEAFNLAIESGNPYQLMVIAPFLVEAHVQTAIEAARAVEKPDERVKAMLAYVGRIKEDQVAAYVAEILAITTSIDDVTDKIDAMFDLLDARPEVGKEEYLNKLLELSMDFVEDGPERGHKLSYLASLLPDRPELKKMALDLGFRMEEEDSSNLSTLIGIVGNLEIGPEEGIDMKILEMIEKRLTEPWERSDVLKTFVSAGSITGRPAILKAIEMIRGLGDPKYVADGLIAVSDKLEGREKEEIRLEAGRKFEEAYELVLKSDDGEAKVDNLVSLAPHLPKHLKVRAIDAALEAARKITDPYSKVRALFSIGQEADVNEVKNIVKEILITPGAILTLGTLESDVVERLQLLGCSRPIREKMVERALKINLGAKNQYEKMVGYASLISHADADLQRQFVSEICDSLDPAVVEPERIVEVATGVAAHAEEPQRQQLMAEADEAARRIENQLRATLSVSVTSDPEEVMTEMNYFPHDIQISRAYALLCVALKTAEPGRAQVVEDAYEALFEHTGDAFREYLRKLCPVLSTERLWEIIHLYLDARKDAYKRGYIDFLTGVGENAGEDDGDDAGETMGQVRVSYNRSPLNLFGLKSVFTLTVASGDLGATIPDGMRYAVGYAMAEGNAEKFSKEDIDFLKIEGKSLMDGSGWVMAFRAVFAGLSDTIGVEKLIEKAEQIWPDGLPVPVIDVFAPRIGQEELKRLLNKAPEIVDPLDHVVERATALAVLLRYQTDPAAIAERAEKLVEMTGTFLGDITTAERLPGFERELGVLDPSIQLRVLQSCLRSAGDRRNFVIWAKRFFPTIERLGGPETPLQIATAILDNADWWP